MTKLLAIKAHPLDAEHSVTVKGFDHFISIYKDLNPNDEVEVLDIYNDNVPEIDADVLTGWDQLRGGADFSELSEASQEKVTRLTELTQQFMDADKILVANPLWNLSIPAKLKAWIDAVAVAGKTFKYTENGPVGLSQGKKIFHLQANGGIWSGRDEGTHYMEAIAKFLGVDSITEFFIEGHHYTPDKEEEIIATALKNMEDEIKKF
jgi:FMN-dependent NADH-azoreductase